MRALVAAIIVVMSPAAGSAREDTPGQVAKQFYALGSQGRCREAEALFSRESVGVINRALQDRGGFAAFCAEKGGQSPLVSLVVKKETIAGDRATVEVMRTYQKGMAFEKDYLVKRDRVWKIVVGENQTVEGSKR